MDVGLYNEDWDCLMLGVFLMIGPLSDSFDRITRLGLVLGLTPLSG